MVQDVIGGEPDEIRVYDGSCKVFRVRTPDGWREVVRVSDSVNILFYDATNNRVLLVRQSRPAIARPGNPHGLITETVAGRFDRNVGVKALAVAEAKEEAGVEITEDDVYLLNGGEPLALSAGILSERAYLAFAKLDPEKMEAEEREFGVDEGEHILRVWIPTEEFLSESYFCEDVRVFAFRQWFAQWLWRTTDADFLHDTL